MPARRASYDKKTLARQVIPLAPGYRTALLSRPVVAENFAQLVSKGKRFCLFPKVSDSVFPGGWGI